MDTLIVIIALAFSWFCGIIVGWKVREFYARQQVDMMLDEIQKKTIEEIKENLIKISIEKQNDIFYVYDLDDNTFMAQGNTKEELEKNLQARYPGKTFAADNENLRQVGLE